MEPVTKQRVVGGLVLLALALIIIPLVVDFTQKTAENKLEVAVPAAPDEMKMKVLPLQDWSQKIEPEVNPQAEVVPPKLTPHTPPPVTVPVTPVAPAAAPATQEKAPPVAKQVDKAAASPGAPASASAEQWVVQAGSFSTEEKAKALSDRLKGMGYPAFLQKGSDNSGAVVYRVRVGPVADRTSADGLQQRLKRDAKIEGLVMHHQS